MREGHDRRRGTAGALLAAAVAAGSLIGCAEGRTSAPAPADEAVSVRVATAATCSLDRAIQATGTLAPREESVVGAKVAGRVRQVLVDVGSRVRRGDVLVQLEPRDWELRERQAAAALAQARAAVGLPLDGSGDDDVVDIDSVTAVREARALLEEATRQRERAAELSQSGILPRSEQDAVEAAWAVAQTRLDRAVEETRTRLATVAQRRAEHDIARQQLADTAIRAPIEGIVQMRQGSVGEYVAVGTPVVTVVESDPLRLRLEVPEREASLVRVGQATRLRVEGDDSEYEGAIARVSPALDEESRMLRIEADVPLSGGLRPGLFARASIVVREAEPALCVPDDALVTFAGIERVLVVEEGKAREKTITTGRRAGATIEVVAGLEPGEVVVRGPGGLRSGQSVVVSSEGASADGDASAGAAGS
jgi:RND family efflux transporter MFP subunit